ncbi:Cation efflux system protein CusA [Novipirellula aureliae]|uniref:Cation efflux system protein CusA n=1 Tax=Novipirellula aureliae TaxID=2527966 RepID=A0A5C6D930_9BACT|nr:efflux RND transporter permease subunit [Novipirellula aureliae]TWU33653.1 Cation efflux system protein CusA [Novipirellula aureliae]
MLDATIRFCVKEPWLVVMLTIGVTVFGWISYNRVPIDAIPNIGENQVIVLTPWPGRSPKDIEDQVTYPLSVSLLAVPGAESVRGKSMFGYSFVQITFKESVDFYWARSRVSEQLGTAAAQLPDGVVPQLGPDATGLGQVFYYVLVPPEDGMSLADLRSLQDFVIKYDLQAVEGVSEVASIGGYVRQYQMEVDPDKLRFHGIPLDQVVNAIRGSNLDVGAKTVETGGMEFIVRGKGLLGSDGDTEKTIRDIEQAVIMQRDGVPVRVRDIAAVQLGPDFRRGALDYNGAEAVGGVIVMRYGENPRAVIERVKDKITQIEPSLKGVTIKGIYDRTGLIDETVATLSTALRDEILITAVVILLFLLHIRSSLIVAVTLPIAVLLSFIAMNVFGVGANIMSLAGIAIAIGTMVDMAIIVSENIYQHLAEWESGGGSEGGGRRGVGSEGGGSEGDGSEGDGSEGDGSEGDGSEGDGSEGDGSEGDGSEGDGSEEMELRRSPTPNSPSPNSPTPNSPSPNSPSPNSPTPNSFTPNSPSPNSPSPNSFTPNSPSSNSRLPSSRSDVIYDAAAEVAPAVLTAVTTTIVSFLPVFFLTGRDYKLFAPLAMTKTFAISAALIAAVTIVPTLCRLMLRSANYRKRTALLAAFAGAALFGLTAFFIWGHHVVDEFDLPLSAVTATAAVQGAVAGWMLTRERVRPMHENIVSRFIVRVYRPTLSLFLRHKLAFASLPVVIVIAGTVCWQGLGLDPKCQNCQFENPTDRVVCKVCDEPLLSYLRPLEIATESVGTNLNELPGYARLKVDAKGLQTDDWIALDEGSWFYMPTLYPAASFSQSMQILQTQDALIGQIPEVKDVLGKIGRIDSALDPAPAAMVETYVMLKPREQWRPGVTAREVWDEINRVATLPGVTPASPLQPIEGRVVMLQSGIKAPMAIRIYGDDLQTLADAALQVSEQLKQSPYVNSGTVNPDIVLGKPYIEFTVDREAASRYGMSAQMVNQVIETALGGMNLINTVEGRERYPVRLRYNRDLRERIEQLDRLPVVTHSGAVVPLGELAKLETTWGPGAINSENARLIAHVSFSSNGAIGDLESISAIEEQLRLAQLGGGSEGGGSEGTLSPTSKLHLPPGYSIEAVGSFRNQIEANNRLMWLVPLVIVINLLVIYLQFRHVPITLAVFAGIPVAFGGGMILLAINGAEMNTAIWVGFIALFGIAVDDGVVIATYLDQVFTRRRLNTIADIRAATIDAGVRRIRPCLMTTATTLVALVPVLMATGRGADVARAMALPVFGGMAVEIVTLFVVPVVYCGFKEFKMQFGLADHHWADHHSAGTEDTPPEDLATQMKRLQ